MSFGKHLCYQMVLRIYCADGNFIVLTAEFKEELLNWREITGAAVFKQQMLNQDKKILITILTLESI